MYEPWIAGVQGWLSSGLDVFSKALAFNTGSGSARCIPGLAKDALLLHGPSLLGYLSTLKQIQVMSKAEVVVEAFQSVGNVEHSVIR